jgi:hypothetical protein
MVPVVTSTEAGASPGPGPSVARGVELLAARAVGGQVDAGVVLVLRAVRRLWLPTLVLGLAWLLAVGDLEEVEGATFTSPADVLGALLSPLAGLAIAFGIRIITSWIGWVAALPRARAELLAEHDRTSALLRRTSDLIFVTGALRPLRFTAAARDVAAARLGTLGRIALLVDRVESWLVPCSIAVFVLVLVLAPDRLGS